MSGLPLLSGRLSARTTPAGWDDGFQHSSDRGRSHRHYIALLQGEGDVERSVRPRVTMKRVFTKSIAELAEADLEKVSGGMQFGPDARLDTSEVQDRRAKNPPPYTGLYFRRNSKGRIEIGKKVNGTVVALKRK